MSDFLSRLEEEHKELSVKTNKLEGFIGSEGFSKVTLNQGRLLSIQLFAMKSYLATLSARLDDLKE